MVWDELRGIPAPPKLGGNYRINVETLTGDKTLVPGVDPIYQYLDEGGADRIITLDSATATIGDRFIIKHDGTGLDAHVLTIKENGTTIDKIWARVYKEFIFDGTSWIGANTGTVSDVTCGIVIGKNARGENAGVAIAHYADAHNEGVAVGTSGLGYDNGVAVGFQAQGHTNGVACGYQALGHTYSVAVGYQADGLNYGTAVGYKADTGDQYYAIALGYLSKCTRYAELAINIDGETDQENQMMLAGWAGETANDTPVEINCGGAANQRFTIRPQSALTFKILVAARDDTADHCADYMFEGLIKRDGAGNTVLSTVTKTVKYEGDATWDCNVTADDANEALIITVTGDADNTVQWAARLDGVETHF